MSECQLYLPVGINFRTSQINDKHFIYLRRIPPITDDALKIAHELQHVLHSDNGMPSLGVKEKKYDFFASAINSSIHDLFDSEPKDELTLLKWSFNYASSKLDYEFIKSEYEYDDDSYYKWFEAKYPKTTEKSIKIKKPGNRFFCLLCPIHYRLKVFI